MQLKPRGWSPDTDDRDRVGLDDLLDAGGCLVASAGSVLHERDGRAVLVDAGYGPPGLPDTGDPLVGEARGGELVANLRGLGWEPHQIGAIAITHLHADHIGWTHILLDGAPAFPRARVVVSADGGLHRADRLHRGLDRAVLDRMATRVATVADGDQAWHGVLAPATAGHTPGHARYVVDGGTERNRRRRCPAQPHPGHPPRVVSPPGHRSHRRPGEPRRLLALLAGPGTTGVAGHFADEVFGRVVDLDLLGAGRSTVEPWSSPAGASPTDRAITHVRPDDAAARPSCRQATTTLRGSSGRPCWASPVTGCPGGGTSSGPA